MSDFVGLKVFAPATVANVAVGYDILGFAINGPGDEIKIGYGKTPGLKIRAIHGAQNRLPKSIEKNTAGVSAQALLEHLGKTDMAIEIDIYKKMPFASGMGSSAASAVAGAFAVNEFLGCPLSKRELLPFVLKGEEAADGAYHADNVAPSLLGGIVLIRNNREHDVIKLPVPHGIYAVVIHPNISVLTADSRDILSDTVSMDQMIEQSGNLAAFVAGLYRSDLELIRRSLKDVIIEPQRAKLIPHFYDLKEIAYKNEALGFSISGAGPSLFALCQNSLIAESVAINIHAHLKSKGVESQYYISEINKEGAVKL